MVMGNLGCVFITGGVVPPFAVDRIGGFVLGASPNPSLQALAVALLDAQMEGGNSRKNCRRSNACPILSVVRGPTAR